MTEKPVILMVEDEKEVLSANRRMLQRRGYQVEQANSAESAYRHLEEQIPDLMILDVMLPDGSGYEICKCFREKSDNPVLFLSGKTDVKDKVKALGLGGDYYLTKPYQFAEMLAVVQRLLERAKKKTEQSVNPSVLRKGSLELDISKATVTLNGEEISLTGKEFGLLMVFMQNEDREFTCAELYERVWNLKAGRDIRTVRKHIMNLRGKIHTDDMDDYDIVTSYGRGYVFCRK